MITKNSLIYWPLLIIDKNASSLIIKCKLFVFNKDSWKQITVCKQMIMIKLEII